jgi:phage terminase large subunit-like protein
MPTPTMMTTSQLLAEAAKLLALGKRDRYRWVCDVPNCNGRPHEGWRHRHARASQRIPAGLWLFWLLMTGRGWGKTRTGAETSKTWAQERPQVIAVISPTHRECRNICFEAPRAGLTRVIPPEDVADYNRSPGDLVLTLANGSVLRGFSAQHPDVLRGYAIDKAWIDEFAMMAEANAKELIDNLLFAMRESDDPRIIVTTTPKAVRHMRRLVRRKRVHITSGHTKENRANLGAAALEELLETYEGTRTGQQELAGKLLEDLEGALWKTWMHEWDGFRIPTIGELPELERIVVAMDPSATEQEDSDNHGLVVMAKDYGQIRKHVEQAYTESWRLEGHGHGRRIAGAGGSEHGYVLWSQGLHASPEKACERAAELWHSFDADALVVEENQGGDWIPAVMGFVDPTIPVTLVHAKVGKRTRAEPISALYERYRVHHVGPADAHADLEEQQRTWVPASGDESPDVMDAMVWAATALFLKLDGRARGQYEHDARR